MGAAHASLNGLGARAQLCGGLEPILFRRPLWTASGLPQLVGERRDVSVPERRDAMDILSLSMPLSVVFERLPGMFVSGEMLAFSLLLPRNMGVGGDVV